MATHLAHKLPWGYIAEIVSLWPPDVAVLGECLTPISHKKKVDHFARCFVSALREFQESDRSTDEELREFQESDRSTDEELIQFNPRKWRHQRAFCAGAWPGYYDTLLSGYVVLNLILYDPARFVPRFVPNGHACERIRSMLGYHDGGHSADLARHLQQAFTLDRLNPLTAEVTKVLRDHAALMFRCMLSISGNNSLLSESFVRVYVCEFPRENENT